MIKINTKFFFLIDQTPLSLSLSLSLDFSFSSLSLAQTNFHHSSLTLIVTTVCYIIHRHCLSPIQLILSICSGPHIFSLSSDSIVRRLGWSLAWHGWVIAIEKGGLVFLIWFWQLELGCDG